MASINAVDEMALPEAQRDAALAFVDRAVKEPDGYNGHAPWWHGWALRMAFHAGAAWAQSAKSKRAA